MRRHVREASMQEGRPIAEDKVKRRSATRQESLARRAASFWRSAGDARAFQIAAIAVEDIALMTAIALHVPEGDWRINLLVFRDHEFFAAHGLFADGRVTKDPVVIIADSLELGALLSRAVNLLGTFGVESIETIRFPNQCETPVRRKIIGEGREARPLDTTSPPFFEENLTVEALWEVGSDCGHSRFVVPKSAPIVSEGVLFRGFDTSYMRALDFRSGRLLWQYKVNGTYSDKGIWSTPALHSGSIYFGAYDGRVYKLDLRNGEVIWSRSYCEWIGSSPLLVPEKDMLVIGLEHERPWARGSMTAMSMHDGRKLWESPVRNFQHGSAAYCQSESSVIWGSADCELVASDINNGDRKWSVQTNGPIKYSPQIIPEYGLVVCGCHDRNVYGADLNDGSIRFVEATDGVCYTTPTCIDGFLLFGSADGYLYIIDLSLSRLVRKIDLGSSIFASPVAVQDWILIGTTSGELYSIHKTSFRVSKIHQMNHPITNAIAFDEESRAFAVSDYLGNMICFGITA